MTMVPLKKDDSPPEIASYDNRPRIYLDDDVVEKLGLSGIPAPGQMYTMRAMVVAERVTASAEEAEEVGAEGMKPDVSLCLILTAVELTPASADRNKIASALYGEDD